MENPVPAPFGEPNARRIGDAVEGRSEIVGQPRGASAGHEREKHELEGIDFRTHVRTFAAVSMVKETCDDKDGGRSIAPRPPSVSTKTK